MNTLFNYQQNRTFASRLLQSAANILGLLILTALFASQAQAQGTAFSYQGNLSLSGSPANGTFDFEFKVFDALSGGAQQGPTLTRAGVTVTNGVFSVELDFGNVFPGAARWLELHVKQPADPSYTTLTPRKEFTSTPYAIRSLSAATANNATQLNGVAAGQYVLTTDARMTDARTPTAGSSNYIQNTTTPQAGANFNISGNGTAGGVLTGNTINAGTQYNINSVRVLAASLSNTYVGQLSGIANGGIGNAFFGVDSGKANNSGSRNTFLGGGSGRDNLSGDGNSFVGNASGISNTSGGNNSFFGANSGLNNKTGSSNSFFGASAGTMNTSACCNSFFGLEAGFSNVSGTNNAFFGYKVGRSNTASRNTFFGSLTGNASTGGNDNTFVGYEAGSANTENGNSFFGSQSGKANLGGVFNAFFGFRSGANNTNGSQNSFFGEATGLTNTTGSINSFFGFEAGRSNTTGSQNTFAGVSSGLNNSQGRKNSFFGSSTGVFNIGAPVTNPITSEIYYRGSNNTFMGNEAGYNHTQGVDNAFFGKGAGFNVRGDIVPPVPSCLEFDCFEKYQGSRNSFFGTEAGYTSLDK